MATPGKVRFSHVETVIFGEHAAAAVPAQLDEWDVERVLIIASTSLNRQTGEVQRLATSLGDRMVEIVDDIPEHTPRGAVLGLTAKAREAGAQAIVTVGGGTLTDAAKAVRMCLANAVENMDDLESVEQSSSSVPIAPSVRQVSVPTTLSAAEFTGIAGVTDESTHSKALWRNPEIAPNSVVLDPWVTIHTPEWLFLSTGLRAVDHAVEGFCALTSNDFTDAQSVRGLRLLYDGLLAVKADPTDIDGRLACQMGAWMAMCGLATGVPMGASHGVGYVLGAAHGVPHGYTSCVMLPAVLRWNSSVNADRQAQLLRQSGIGEAPLADLIAELVARLELPTNLAELGIDPERDSDIAEGALGTPWVPFNPKRIDNPHQVREILALAR